MNSQDKRHIRKHVNGVLIHFITPLFVVIIFSLGLVHWLPQDIKINIANYYNGVVTLSTGAMVAIFLAVFYSDAERVEYIREKAAALVLFATILIDLILIVLSGLLININRTSDITVLVILTTLLFDLVWLIVRLMFIALKAVR